MSAMPENHIETGTMEDDATVSPYLLRPLRSYREALRERMERKQATRPCAAARSLASCALPQSDGSDVEPRR